MDDEISLSHTRWECKYHIVFIPKCRRRALYSYIRKDLGRVLAELARQRESHIETGSIQEDHVHMVISIPPKYSVAQVVGYIKGKSAIYIAWNYSGKKKNFTGEHFWARGYYVSTIGKDEQMIKEYVQRQQAEDKRIANLQLD
ncbi:MAG: IS200/IS605 family transposase [Armatimonadota bacterium]